MHILLLLSWHIIDQWDKSFFLFLNTQLHIRFLDWLMPWWRTPSTWIPLYIFLFVFSIIKFKTRTIPWFIFIAITLTISDQLSSTVIKWWIHRPRPCQDPIIMAKERLLLSYCPGNPSFTSSHAANHYAAATFFVYTLKSYIKKWRYLFWFWAFTISYAQVYVGVHYPIDVVAGGILGFLIGWTISSIYTCYFYLSKIEKKNNPTLSHPITHSV